MHTLPKTLQQPSIQAPKTLQLGFDDIPHFERVLPDLHAEIAAVGETGNLFVELDFGEGLGEEEEGGAEGGGEVDLVGKPDSGIVVEDADLVGGENGNRRESSWESTMGGERVGARERMREKRRRRSARRSREAGEDYLRASGSYPRCKESPSRAYPCRAHRQRWYRT